MRRHLSLLVLGSALIVSPALAAEAPSNPYPTCNKNVSPAESENAHQKYVAGKLDYDEANYDSAIRRFRDAYALDCTKHELLIIISAAYERKGDKKEAVAALETFLARVPTSPDAGTYQTKIENLKKLIAAQAPPPPPPEQPKPEMHEHSVVPWVLVGAGVVALGVGIALVATAPDLPPDCDRKTEECIPRPGETPAQLQKRQDEAGRALGQPLWGTVTIIGGGALVAGGLIWHFLEPTGPKEKVALRPSPAVAPGFAGVSLGGSF